MITGVDFTAALPDDLVIGATDKDIRAIGVLAVAMIRRRTQVRKRDHRNRSFVPYTPGYADTRARAGLSRRPPDMTFTGKMMKGMGVTKSQAKSTKSVMVVGWRNRKLEQRAGFVSEKRPFTLLNRTEIRTLADELADRLLD